MNASSFHSVYQLQTSFRVKEDVFIDIKASNIKMNFTTISMQMESPLIIETQDYHGECMLNPLCLVANGLPFYTIMIDVWFDDLSGNRSKSYNKHNNTCFSNRSLPRRLLQQEYHIHFAGTSQHASPTEQAGAVKEMIEWVAQIFFFLLR